MRRCSRTSSGWPLSWHFPSYHTVTLYQLPPGAVDEIREEHDSFQCQGKAISTTEVCRPKTVDISGHERAEPIFPASDHLSLLQHIMGTQRSPSNTFSERYGKDQSEKKTGCESWAVDNSLSSFPLIMVHTDSQRNKGLGPLLIHRRGIWSLGIYFNSGLGSF